jgi:hypothetical protein
MIGCPGPLIMLLFWSALKTGDDALKILSLSVLWGPKGLQLLLHMFRISLKTFEVSTVLLFFCLKPALMCL